MALVVVVGVGAEVPWGVYLAHRQAAKDAASSGSGANSTSSACSISCSGDSGDVPSQAFGAFDVCKQFVSDRLKAPNGATWRDPIGNQVVYSGSGDGPWTVNASVDSQNSFGADLRSTYTCTVTDESGSNWALDNLIFSDGGNP